SPCPWSLPCGDRSCVQPLEQVRPRLPPPNPADRALADAVIPRQLGAGHSLLEGGVDSQHVGLAQYVGSVTLPVRRPTPDVLVVPVVGMGARKQVARLHARWVVAAVANDFPVRDRAVVDRVGEAMRLPPHPVDRGLPVSIVTTPTCPDQAGSDSL